MVMSRQAFQFAIATAEFQSKAKTYLPAQLQFQNLNILNLPAQETLAMNVFGVEQIEFYDDRFFTKDDAGNQQSARFWPINYVCLEDSADDGNPAVLDVANGLVFETAVAAMAPASEVVGRMPPPGRGPRAYVTVKGDLDPPNVTVWAAQRAFPRKKQLQANAWLNVGNFTDTITLAPDLF